MLIFCNFFSAVVIPYWIVDTDYSNYALAYSCVDISADYRMGKLFSYAII